MARLSAALRSWYDRQSNNTLLARSNRPPRPRGAYITPVFTKPSRFWVIGFLSLFFCLNTALSVVGLVASFQIPLSWLHGAALDNSNNALGSDFSIWIDYDTYAGYFRRNFFTYAFAPIVNLLVAFAGLCLFARHNLDARFVLASALVGLASWAVILGVSMQCLLGGDVDILPASFCPIGWAIPHLDSSLFSYVPNIPTAIALIWLPVPCIILYFGFSVFGILLVRHCRKMTSFGPAKRTDSIEADDIELERQQSWRPEESAFAPVMEEQQPPSPQLPSPTVCSSCAACRLAHDTNETMEAGPSNSPPSYYDNQIMEALQEADEKPVPKKG